MLPVDQHGNRQCPGNIPGGAHGSGATGIALPQEPAVTGPNAVPGRTPEELQMMRNQCADKLQKAKNVGNNGAIPGGFLRWAEDMLRPPPYDFTKFLRTRAQKVKSWVLGRRDRTFSQPSRRQGIYGYGANAPQVAAKRAPRANWGVALDTSGSMDDDDIAMGLGVISQVMRAANSKVRFLSCDAAVNTLVEVGDMRELKKHVVGGGGTNFIPMFDVLAKDPPAALFILTDGDGPAPVINPLKDTEIVWLLIGDHAVIPYLNGHRASTVPYGHIIWTSAEARDRNRSKEESRKRVLPSEVDGDGSDDDDDDPAAAVPPTP